MSLSHYDLSSGSPKTVLTISDPNLGEVEYNLLTLDEKKPFIN